MYKNILKSYEEDLFKPIERLCNISIGLSIGGAIIAWCCGSFQSMLILLIGCFIAYCTRTFFELLCRISYGISIICRTIIESSNNENN